MGRVAKKPEHRTIDREAVRVLVVAVGCREAGRQLGIPTGTIQCWSSRYKWTEKRLAAERAITPDTPTTIAELTPEIMQAQCKTPTLTASHAADTLARTLKADSEATKTNLSFATRTASESLRNRSGQWIVNNAKQLRDIAATASQIHGWDDKKEGRSPIQFNLMIGGMT